MPVLNISTAVIKDRAAFLKYVEQAAILLQAHGVEVLCRGRHVETMLGQEASGHIVAVFRFANLDEVRRFYEGPAYQPLVTLRDAACDMTIQLYEE